MPKDQSKISMILYFTFDLNNPEQPSRSKGIRFPERDEYDQNGKILEEVTSWEAESF